MITEKEYTEVELSPTKADFYQIYNELLETADKLSKRWSPSSTNESDPGIVLLKVLTAIADKLNYQIDKNTLEAFMPSAAQEESMRKLCEMMGYNMKYYQSATTDVTISYKYLNDESNPAAEDGRYLRPATDGQSANTVTIPRYSNIKDINDSINYVTLKDCTLSYEIPYEAISCIEGELIECESEDDNVISVLQLDDNYRYYLPENQIAENGIFINNVYGQPEEWDKVDNLNTQENGKKCWKFGYDSKLNKPYIQFPDDISLLIENGLQIRYIRTNGANGNIAAGVLAKLEKPEEWEPVEAGETNDLQNVENFAITNSSASTNGTNKESLEDAYNSYKKTIGTFDTLVTCRDYMNKIYQMTVSDTDTTPLVSNIVVSDIRDDINRAATICTLSENGVSYKNIVLTETIDTADETEATDDKKPLPLINNFDLIFYPFKPITTAINKDTYESSFEFDNNNILLIENQLADTKCLAHNIKLPIDDTDIICIKNYLKLNAKITTVRKVNVIEEQTILKNIKQAIYTNFNMRKLEFGEPIPFDSILETIENADTRIKNVSLEEPELETKFVTKSGEYGPTDTAENFEIYKKHFNKLAIRNVLAGRIPLFNYDNNFKPEYTEKLYTKTGGTAVGPVFPSSDDDKKIVSIEANCDIELRDFTDDNGTNNPIVLAENEVIQFRAPNFRTTLTYPAYVNYYFKKGGNHESTGSTPAKFCTLEGYLTNYNLWEDLLKNVSPGATEVNYNINNANKYKAFFEKGPDGNYTRVSTPTPDAKYFVFDITGLNWGVLTDWIKGKLGSLGSDAGIYRQLTADTSKHPGKYIDANFNEYKKRYQYTQSTESQFDINFIPIEIGEDADFVGIHANTEYYLTGGDKLYINYTKAAGDDTEQQTVVNKILTDCIIRPNFDLWDSSEYAKTHSYSKKGQIQFQGVPALDGMFTLGASEQIELREQVMVDLDSACFLYWERKDEEPDADGKTITFKFDEDGGMSYTLKDGEYLCYTNAAKTTMSYYGSGTVITRSNDNVNLTKSVLDKHLDIVDLMTNGLGAAIDWKYYSAYMLNNDNKLQVKEYQYITLGKGDSLVSIDTELSKLDYEFKNISSARYKLNGTEADLPQLHFPADSSFSWQACSKLLLNLGPTQAQAIGLNSDHSSRVQTSLIINYEGGTTDTITADNSTHPIYLKSNIVCQSADHITDVRTYIYDNETGKRLKETDEFKLKVFEQEELQNIEIGNSGQGKWTLIKFNSVVKQINNLQVLMPKTDYCLISLYYIPKDKTKTTAKMSVLGTETIIKHFNEDTGTGSQLLLLNTGLNTIQISEADTLTISADDGDVILLSNPTFINSAKAINPAIMYNGDILSDIKNILTSQYIKDDEEPIKFYYDAVLDNSLLIDLNQNYLSTTDEPETLETSRIWYDYNNVNNKFVISEIDPDLTGITLTRSSRL